MKLSTWPLLDALSDSRKVLLAGAGGGFDLYSGIPLYFALSALGKEVHLANLSFASLPTQKELRITDSCVAVSADLEYYGSYFPELYLAVWFRERHAKNVTIYAFPQTGVAPLRVAYQKLHSLLDLDAVVLVDGGTDSLMRGDEVGLGTPHEDIASIAAASGSGISNKFLVCIGFGIDTFHGICHAQFLEGVADLAKRGAYLGLSAVISGMPEAAEYLSAVDYANSQTERRQSIVQNSIASSIEGDYGDCHRTNRTEGSHLWINPLMPVYWAFRLEGVAKRNLYIDSISESRTMMDIDHAIERFRTQVGIRSWKEMPV